MDEVEIQQIDCRFEGFRLQDVRQQQVLLSSIMEGGIREPLQGVSKGEDTPVLLDGFKRLRCAKMLGMGVVPWVSLSADEPTGLLQLLRNANARSLNILEQAAFLDTLKDEHGMSVVSVARFLECSPAWVSVRLGMLGEMSAVVKEAVFSGKLPVRSYMYGLRPFTRVKGVKRSEIDDFVEIVSGKGLSSRQIESLAYGYFRGGEHLRKQIQGGNLDWTLRQLRGCASWEEDHSLHEWEKRMLKDLELSGKYMGRVTHNLDDSRLKADSFFRTAHVLVEGLLGKIVLFQKSLETFHAQRR